MTIERSWKFHLKFGVRLLLITLGVFLVGIVFVRLEFLEGIESRLSAFESDSVISRARFERRLAEIADTDRAARELLLVRLQEISAAQESQVSGITKSPFAVESLAPAIVELICVDNAATGSYYTGSGTMIEESGLIITNQHIVLSDDGSFIRLCGVGITDDVSVPPRISFLARLIAADADNDLALLKITERVDGTAVSEAFQSVDLKDSGSRAQALSIGDPVYIGGYPGVGAETLTLTQGVVSGRVGDHLIKTSAFIDSGASGGAVFDAAGRYVGVPTAAARGDIGGSLGYLISADAIETFLEGYRAGTNLVTAQDAD